MLTNRVHQEVTTTIRELSRLIHPNTNHTHPWLTSVSPVIQPNEDTTPSISHSAICWTSLSLESRHRLQTTIET
ncbi:hypothetical protein M8J76_005224 [Diaphorina citri]|nr:hypothetical protein M8J76_005224 [Diaphorina citri]